jgi:hypothetical protein
MKSFLKYHWLYLSAALIVVVATIFKPAEVDEKDPDIESFSSQMLSAIRTKNYDGFKKLFLTSGEFTDIVMSSGASEDDKVARIQEFDEMMAESSGRDKFDEFIQELSDKEVDFAGITYDHTEFNISDDAPDMQVASVKICFKSKGVDFELTAYDAFKTKGGWKLVRYPYVRRGPEKDPTCEVFAKEILEMLKKDNKDEYKKMVITDDDFIALVRNSKFDLETQNGVIEKINKESPYRKAVSHYHEIMAEITGDEIDLNAIKDMTIEYKKQTEKGVSFAEVEIAFTYNEKEYTLRIGEILKTPKGWKLSRKMRLSKPYDEGYYDEEAPAEEVPYDEEMVDTTAAVDYEYSDEQLQQVEAEMNRLLDSIRMQQVADSIKAVEMEKKDKGKKKKGK